MALNDVGGVGKSASAMLAYEIMRARGLLPRTIELELTRKFSRLLGAVGEKVDEALEVPGAEVLRVDPERASLVFMPILEAMLCSDREDTVVDIAATLATGFLETIEAAEHGDGVPGQGAFLTFLIPLSPTDEKHREGALRAARALRRAYPRCRIVLVINRAPKVTAEAERAQREVTSGELGSLLSSVVVIPREDGQLTAQIYERTLTPHRAIQALEPETIMQLTGIPTLTHARLAKKWHAAWYWPVADAMDQALFGSVPSEPEAEPGPRRRAKTEA